MLCLVRQCSRAPYLPNSYDRHDPQPLRSGKLGKLRWVFTASYFSVVFGVKGL